MKIKIELEDGEGLEEAEDKLSKAIKKKDKIPEIIGEQYADPALNEFHDMIMEDFDAVLEEIKNNVEVELKNDVNV